jgi:type I restriction enzyme S subunit
MSRIQELIDELCPEGVPFKPLNEIAATITGLSGKTKADFSGGNARFASYKNIFANPSLDLLANDFVKVATSEKQNALKLGDLLVTGSSESRDEVGYTSVVTSVPQEPVYLNSFCFAVRWHSEHMMNANYVKHLFRSEAIREQIRAASNGVTRINISKPKFMKIEVPIPPLPVQAEIALILDNFKELEAELEAELKAELEARKKQNRSYRDRLLNFESGEAHPMKLRIDELCPSGVPFKELHEVALLTAGDRVTKSQMSHIGQYAAYGAGTVPTGRYDAFNRENSMIISRAGAGAGFVNFIGEKFWATDVCFVGEQKAGGPDIRFVFYWLKSQELELMKKTYGGSMPKIDKRYLWTHPVPLPHLEVQREIVRILDNFTALESKLESKLESELEARRQQYEHYRNKLLTFKEAS